MAVTARNLITVNTTLFGAFPSIVIPSLIGLNDELNIDESIRVTASQASWIGEAELVFYIFQMLQFRRWIFYFVAGFASIAHPFGAFAGWITSDLIGRRKSLLIACVPFIFAWSVLAFARSLSTIYIAFIVMGLGLGLKEASSLAYTGEIWYV